MVFGEIVEPSTRALYDDDYKDEETPNLSWNVPPAEPPASVDKLFVVETAPLRAIFETCVLGDLQSVCELNGGSAKVYEVDNSRVIVCDDRKSVAGLITEKFVPFLECGCEVVVMTSAATTSQDEDCPSCVRQLCYGTKYTHPKLDVPNLVTGVSAGVFSYCIHKNIRCSLFKAFFDAAPLDSINTMPFVNLLKSLGVSLLKSYKFQEAPSPSNLYI